MRVLVYRRTHPGDPDGSGCFGVQDCMHSVRNRKFDAVIGVGGIGAWPKKCDIDGKVNWIGIGARKHKPPRGWKGQLVTFDHFLLREHEGPSFRGLAPILANRIYKIKSQCSLVKFNDAEMKEIEAILHLAESAPPSKWRRHRRMPTKCPPKHKRKC